MKTKQPVFRNGRELTESEIARMKRKERTQRKMAKKGIVPRGDLHYSRIYGKFVP
jgi:hypothetical protein